MGLNFQPMGIFKEIWKDFIQFDNSSTDFVIGLYKEELRKNGKDTTKVCQKGVNSAINDVM